MREKLPEIPQHKKTSSINWSYVLTAATLAAGSACLIAGSLAAPATQPYWFCMGALLIARGLFSLLKMAAGFAMRTYMQHRFFNASASKETEDEKEPDFTPQPGF